MKRKMDEMGGQRRRQRTALSGSSSTGISALEKAVGGNGSRKMGGASVRMTLNAHRASMQ